MGDRSDVYEKITGQIIANLEKGIRVWAKPWNAEHAADRITRPLRANLTSYRGINIVMLWASAEAQGFMAAIWTTYKQAAEFGGQVRKGEKGTLVVYANRITVAVKDEETGAEEEAQIPFMKGYTVFNVEQIDGLPAEFLTPAAPVLDPVQRIAEAEAFFQATGAEIRHGGNRAYYSLASDHVQMPPFESFKDAESYHTTLAHECCHWTRAPSRLDRDFGRKRLGDAGYAREELVAELGAAFLAADLGLALEPREDHAGYIAGWLDVLKADKRAIFSAAAYAQRAVDYLQELQPADLSATGPVDPLAE
jgi:antirestriction protein ArdC